MIGRIKKMWHRLTRSPKKPLEQNQLPPERLVPAALRHLEELARSKHTPDRPQVSTEGVADPGDVVADSNTEVDRTIALTRNRHLAKTPNNRIINFQQWGNC